MNETLIVGGHRMWSGEAKAPADAGGGGGAGARDHATSGSAQEAPHHDRLRRRGLLFVISSPSGAGKTTLSKRLLTEEPALQLSISMTTRPPRTGERDGVDYRFVDEAQFRAAEQSGALLEHARVFGNLYGTPRQPVEDALARGRDVLFDIDWQGARQLRASAGADVVSVFILPPSALALEQRLQMRGQDPADVVAGRMARAGDEMSHWHEYDYVIVNAEIDTAVTGLRQIIAAERLRTSRGVDLAGFVDHARDQLTRRLANRS